VTRGGVRWALCALAVGVGSARAPGQQRAFVEVQGPERAVVEQSAVFEVVIGWDRAWFDQHAVALSRQRTDVPLHLDVPWLRASDRYVAAVLAPRDGEETRSAAVGDRVVAASLLDDATVAGRAFTRVAVRVRVVPTRAGALELEPARVRYAFATEFRDHLLRGREPVDRQEGATSSAPRQLVVRRLSGAAPADYSGAVGAFAVEWSSGGEQVPVGQPFEVVMSVYGGEESNLDRIRPPSFLDLDGFHVQGVIERPVEVGREFVVSLVPLRVGAAAVDGLSFVRYAPATDEYVRTARASVPVLVAPRRAGVELDPGVEELIRQDERERSGVAAWLRWVFVGLAVVGLTLFRFDRGRRRRSGLATSLASLREALTTGDAQASASAFEALLARVGGGETFASPTCWQSLSERGVTAEGVGRLKELQRALDQARFGGPLPDRADVLAAAETLVGAAKG